ncbi:hypothetical protein Xmau_02969 [Xenorhabdus mauleonii]|uniref:Uncharacterized protein n=1 Tax=Xenorhabdus mauleonii TaxID=351675 RepID=A0A1I3T827_9GAMM|nr:hypothetical protein Xmau_02969 [Xenorhabdus mauleonii]SFJ66469.1 hypothetical protein SAMN05421680_11314 [Xenorhabdus mauleonii]
MISLIPFIPVFMAEKLYFPNGDELHASSSPVFLYHSTLSYEKNIFPSWLN